MSTEPDGTINRSLKPLPVASSVRRAEFSPQRPVAMPPPMAKSGHSDLSTKRSVELDAIECTEVKDVLYAEAARIMEEARKLPHRLSRRRVEEGHADRLRMIAEKFDD